MISVASDQSKADAGLFAKEVKATFPVVHDPKGLVFSKYGIEAIPVNVIVNRQGKVTRVIVGADTQAMDAAVAAAMT